MVKLALFTVFTSVIQMLGGLAEGPTGFAAAQKHSLVLQIELWFHRIPCMSAAVGAWNPNTMEMRPFEIGQERKYTLNKHTQSLKPITHTCNVPPCASGLNLWPVYITIFPSPKHSLRGSDQAWSFLLLKKEMSWNPQEFKQLFLRELERINCKGCRSEVVLCQKSDSCTYLVLCSIFNWQQKVSSEMYIVGDLGGVVELNQRCPFWDFTHSSE